MANVNIDRLVKANSKRSTIYTPLYEAIVNSLESIKDSARKDGQIEVTFFRKQLEMKLETDDAVPTAPQITDITITDNGVGFTEENYNSFYELHSDYKQSRGGKGLGRIFFRQYFSNVSVESLYKDKDYENLIYRSFDFTKRDFAENEVFAEIDERVETYTNVILANIKTEEKHKLDRKIETIARKLLEHLLYYFVDDGYECPKIILRDDSTGNSITLNDFFEKSKDIVNIGSDHFKVKSLDGVDEYDFKIKTFKIFFSHIVGSIYLTANQRVVTKTPIHEYMNVFRSGFYEKVKIEGNKTIEKNYIVAGYVSGPFLDENVSGERGEFLLSNDNSTVSPINLKNIETAAVNIVAGYFDKDVNERTDKKVKKVAAYVNTEAPWLREFIVDIDLEKIAFDSKPEDINTVLEQAKNKRDMAIKSEIKTLIDTPPEDNTSLSEAVEKISTKVTKLGKSDLVQHVVLRKAVIDLFRKALEWDTANKYNKEDAVHSIIFPLKKTTDDLSYEKHNLWMIDERLSFHSYAASDLSIKPKGDRPDIVVFDNPILVRDSDTLSTPINIIEFKRPQRKNYPKDEDPLKQVRKYVAQIRSGDYVDKNGLPIAASKSTPAYGFVVADLTPKVREFCEDAQLTEDPDHQGYHGFHSKWDIYFEIVSFKKLLNNAELRNKILFSKLGII